MNVIARMVVVETTASKLAAAVTGVGSAIALAVALPVALALALALALPLALAVALALTLAVADASDEVWELTFDVVEPLTEVVPGVGESDEQTSVTYSADVIMRHLRPGVLRTTVQLAHVSVLRQTLCSELTSPLAATMHFLIALVLLAVLLAQ